MPSYKDKLDRLSASVEVVETSILNSLLDHVRNTNDESTKIQRRDAETLHALVRLANASAILIRELGVGTATIVPGSDPVEACDRISEQLIEASRVVRSSRRLNNHVISSLIGPTVPVRTHSRSSSVPERRKAVTARPRSKSPPHPPVPSSLDCTIAGEEGAKETVTKAYNTPTPL